MYKQDQQHPSYHCSTPATTAAPQLPLQRPSYHCSAPATTAAPQLSLQHPSYHCSTPATTAAPQLPLQHPSYHCSTPATTAAPQLPLQHPSYHCSTPAITAAPQLSLCDLLTAAGAGLHSHQFTGLYALHCRVIVLPALAQQTLGAIRQHIRLWADLTHTTSTVKDSSFRHCSRVYPLLHTPSHTPHPWLSPLTRPQTPLLPHPSTPLYCPTPPHPSTPLYCPTPPHPSTAPPLHCPTPSTPLYCPTPPHPSTAPPLHTPLLPHPLHTPLLPHPSTPFHCPTPSTPLYCPTPSTPLNTSGYLHRVSALQFSRSALRQMLLLDAGWHLLQHTWFLSLQVAPGNSLQVDPSQHWSAPSLEPKPRSHSSSLPTMPSPQNSCDVSGVGTVGVHWCCGVFVVCVTLETAASDLQNPADIMLTGGGKCSV